MSGRPAGAPVVTYNPNIQCDCWAATLHIANLCSRGRGHSQGQSTTQARVQAQQLAPSPSSSSIPGAETPAPQRSMLTSLLSDTLTMARNLVQHWETLNGCASSASHMEPQTLRYMVESISWVLGDYETALEAISRGASERQAPAERSIPRVCVGTLELDPAEAIIVAQEALSHSTARLIIMLQDIEEEAALRHQQPDEDCSLQEKNLKNLVTRLFQLLRKINKLTAEPE